MVKYKKYTTKTGKERWKYKGYWGIDSKTGQPIQPQKQGFKSKKDAKLDYERTIFELDNQQGDIQNKKITINDLWKEYSEYYRASGVMYTTFEHVERAIRLHVLPVIGKYYVDMLTIKDCQLLVEKVRHKRKDYRSIINSTITMLDYAVENQYCQQNQLRKIVIKSSKETYKSNHIENNVYDPEQLVTFLDFCKTHSRFYVYVFFRLLAFTGLRKSEALALKISDLDINNKTLSVSRTLTTTESERSAVSEFTKTKYSHSKKDKIMLDDVTFNLLLELIQNNKLVHMYTSDFIFVNPKSGTFFCRATPNDWMLYLWAKYNDELKALGLHRITPHGLRHSHATLLHALGVSAKDAQHRLRHAKIQTTLDIYTHISEQQITATAKILNTFEAGKVKSKVTF